MAQRYARFTNQLQKLMEEIRSEAEAGDPIEQNVSTDQAPSMRSRISTPVGRPQVTILPFQIHLWNLRGESSGVGSQSISGMEGISKMVAGCRRAELLELSAKVIPNHRALKYPFSIDAIWIPQDRVMNRKTLMSSYGVQSIVVGDSQMGSRHLSIDADFRTMNPIVKDSVNYNDLPILFAGFRPNEEVIKIAKKKDADGKEITPPILACVCIVGVIKLSAPSVHFTDESDMSEEC